MARPVLLCALGALLLLAACPGQKTGNGLGTGSGTGSGSGAPGNDTTLTFDPFELNGTFFTPGGLDRPLLLLAHGKKKVSIADQKKIVKKAKAEQKVGEATILSTLLYEASQKESDDNKRITLVNESRQVLIDVQAELPDLVDALLLHNLACLSYDLNDMPTAIAAFDAAIKKAPTDAHAGERKAYLAYYLVRDGKNAEAAAAVADLTPSKDEPEQAYAIAWAAWRTGDLDRARAGMLAAVQGWRYAVTLAAIKRDTLIFPARAGSSVDEAVAFAKAYAALASKDPKSDSALLETLVYMHQAFTIAGRARDSIALVDAMLGLDSVSKSDAPKLRLKQADAARIVGDTGGVVSYATKAVELLSMCGNDCDAQTYSDAAKLVFNLSRLAAIFYNTSQDENWFTAGKAMYALYAKIPGVTDADTVKKEADNFELGHKNAKKGAGIHDKTALQFVLGGRAPEVLGCYDGQLQRDKQLGGSVTLTLEVGQDGKVAGASSDPGGGEQGLAAVASCATERARGWVFPARTSAGVTRVVAAYTLQPQATK